MIIEANYALLEQVVACDVGLEQLDSYALVSIALCTWKRGDWLTERFIHDARMLCVHLFKKQLELK